MACSLLDSEKAFRCSEMTLSRLLLDFRRASRPGRNRQSLSRRIQLIRWRPSEGKKPSLQVLSDPQTGEAPGRTRGRNARSKNQCSMCPAIHTKSRSWLRSSSTREPSDPLLRVVLFFGNLTEALFAFEIFFDRDFFFSARKRRLCTIGAESSICELLFKPSPNS